MNATKFGLANSCMGNAVRTIFRSQCMQVSKHHH